MHAPPIVHHEGKEHVVNNSHLPLHDTHNELQLLQDLQPFLQ